MKFWYASSAAVVFGLVWVASTNAVACVFA